MTYRWIVNKSNTECATIDAYPSRAYGVVTHLLQNVLPVSYTAWRTFKPIQCTVHTKHLALYIYSLFHTSWIHSVIIIIYICTVKLSTDMRIIRTCIRQKFELIDVGRSEYQFEISERGTTYFVLCMFRGNVAFNDIPWRPMVMVEDTRVLGKKQNIWLNREYILSYIWSTYIWLE
jgi:hypothetical protein